MYCHKLVENKKWKGEKMGKRIKEGGRGKERGMEGGMEGGKEHTSYKWYNEFLNL